jgi:GxxExxY protein
MEEQVLAVRKRQREPLPPELNRLTGRIVEAAFSVHQQLGPGLLESVYELCLAAELRHSGINFHRQVGVDILYRDVTVESGLRLDFLIENTVIVELKSVEFVLPVHQAQLLSYLRLAKKPIGLLINFNVPLIRDGIERIVNPDRPNLCSSAPPR